MRNISKEGNLRECVSCKRCYPPDQQFCQDCFVELITHETIPYVVNERYQLDRVLNRGGGSLFFAALDLSAQQRVGLKLMRASVMADPRAQDRFLREADLAASFRHPAIAAVLAFGLLPDASGYVASEFAPGISLRYEMNRVITFPLKTSVALLSMIADALEAAHHAGLVHRDLKPECVFLNFPNQSPDAPPKDAPEAAPQVMLVDFSFARVSLGHEHVPGTSVKQQGRGKLPLRPTYLSPEQYRGVEADLRSDIFSLGVIGYEMLAGQPPFMAKRVGEFGPKLLREKPGSLRSLNPEVKIMLEAEIMRAMEKDPRNRHQSAAEFKRELLNALTWE
jgi:serine/threonine-protein kinase